MSEIASIVSEFNSHVENADFANAFSILQANLEDISKKLQSSAIGEALKKTTNDRVVFSFIDSVGFGQCPIEDSMHKLEKLLQVKEGALVLAKTWGLGEVKRVDYFYRRITVDFKTKRAHQYTYDVAAENLDFPGEDHILVLARSDAQRVSDLLKNHHGEFVKKMLKSYGDMPLLKLEKLTVENGFVKKENWKKFWESARAELKKDRCVEIPVKKTEPIVLKTVAEDYGETWLMAFEHETEPNKILADVREYVACGKFAGADETVKAKLAGRLQFALVAASMSDEALYARLACLVTELKSAPRQIRCARISGSAIVISGQRSSSPHAKSAPCSIFLPLRKTRNSNCTAPFPNFHSPRRRRSSTDSGTIPSAAKSWANFLNSPRRPRRWSRISSASTNSLSVGLNFRPCSSS